MKSNLETKPVRRLTPGKKSGEPPGWVTLEWVSELNDRGAAGKTAFPPRRKHQSPTNRKRT